MKRHYREACLFVLEIANGDKSIEEIMGWLQNHTEQFHAGDKEKYLKDIIRDIEYGEKEKDGE